MDFDNPDILLEDAIDLIMQNRKSAKILRVMTFFLFCWLIDYKNIFLCYNPNV